MVQWVKFLDGEYFLQQDLGKDHRIAKKDKTYPVADLVQSLAAAAQLRNRKQLKTLVERVLKALHGVVVKHTRNSHKHLAPHQKTKERR